MMIKNILVLVDGSKYSVKEFNAALDIAKKYGAKISVLTCLEKENISAWCTNKKAAMQIIAGAEKFTHDFLSKLEKIAKDAQFHFLLVLLRQNPSQNRLTTLTP